MKKLLALLGSVGLVASTTAIAVACKNKIPVISLSTDKNGAKEKSEDQLKDKPSEKAESAPQTDQPKVEELDEETKKKEVDEAKEAVKKAEESEKSAKVRYRKAHERAKLEKDKPSNETLDEIEAATEELLNAQKELKIFRDKLQKLENSL
ncbi:lipoprotein [Mycoplasma capricolum]|uniref:lipoprotein n=1 Tax=Mycoplasma capricolum TaxID=2095 RepID=UPI003DA44BC0